MDFNNAPSRGLFCRKCRNHGLLVYRDRMHSKCCEFLTCKCLPCLDTEQKRQDSKKYRKLSKSVVNTYNRVDQLPGAKQQRANLDPRMVCPKCRHHGLSVYKFKGHTERCEFRVCSCLRCKRVDRNRLKRLVRDNLVSVEPTLVCVRCKNHGKHVTWNHRHGKPCYVEACACPGCPAAQQLPDRPAAQELAPTEPTSVKGDVISRPPLCATCTKHKVASTSTCRFRDCDCQKCMKTGTNSSTMGYIPLLDASAVADGSSSADIGHGSQDILSGAMKVEPEEKREPMETNQSQITPMDESIAANSHGDESVRPTLPVHVDPSGETSKSPKSLEISSAECRRDVADESDNIIRQCLRKWAENVLRTVGTLSSSSKTSDCSSQGNDSNVKPLPVSTGVPQPPTDLIFSTQLFKTPARSAQSTSENGRNSKPLSKLAPTTVAVPQLPRDLNRTLPTSSRSNDPSMKFAHKPTCQGSEPTSSRVRSGLRLCLECDAVLETDELLDQHVCEGKEAAPQASGTQGLWFCDYCHLRLTSRTDLAWHHISRHAWESTGPSTRSVEASGTDDLVTLERMLHLFTLLNDVNILSDEISNISKAKT